MTDAGWASLCLREAAENARRAAKSIRLHPGKFGRFAREVADAHAAAAEVYERKIKDLESKNG